MRRGFTLIEVLVVIGVIGLLIALLTPVLSGARALALETVSLSNARQCWSIIDQYAQANREFYPRCQPDTFYGPPGGPGGYGVRTEVEASFLTTAHWYGVVRDIAPFHEFRGVFESPRRSLPDDAGFYTSYLLMPAFTVKGALWTPAAASMTPERLAEFATDIRRSEVSYPASKVGMYDGDVSYVRTPPRIDGLPNMKVVMAFADGHGEARNPQNASEPFPNALFPERSPIRLHNTAGGAQGRDY